MIQELVAGCGISKGVVRDLKRGRRRKSRDGNLRQMRIECYEMVGQKSNRIDKRADG